MTTSSGLLDIAGAVAWFSLGGLCLATSLRDRGCINSLPPARGDRRLRWQNRFMLAGGLVALLAGAWNTLVHFAARGL